MLMLNAVVPALLWLWICWHLHSEWSLTAQYNYGWAVPFLSLFLFWLRWQQRPPPAAPRRHELFRWSILAALLPVRIVEEANPDWRLLGWCLALLVVAYSAVVLLETGSRPWLRHFAFPICFPLVAVPWLVQVENAVIQAMTHAVAYGAVEIAGWSGIGAYQIGNIIQLSNGSVGVDEACSGVKTLQAGIMVALFFGELLRLPATRRVMLVLAGCGWVFACNIVRAATLMMIAARRDLPEMARWHDLVGSAVLVLGMAGLIALAFALQKEERAAPEATILASPRASLNRFSTFAALAWLVAIFAVTEIWYRAHERHLVDQPAWEAQWPLTEANAAPIAEATAAILRYDEGSSAIWKDREASQWWGFFARWKPRRTALQLVRSHSPEICLPAAGRTFLGERMPVEVVDGEISLRFRSYEFTQGELPLFVFVVTEEDKHAAEDVDRAIDWTTQGRIRAAWHGERNLGQRLLELAVIGPRDFAQARAALAETARQVVRTTATR